MENLEPIVLLKDKNAFERIIAKIIETIGYSFGSIPLIFRRKKHKSMARDDYFNIQAATYVENDSIVYCALPCKEKVVNFKELETIDNILIRSAKLYPDTPCFGKRALLEKITVICPVTHKELIKYSFGQYRWKNFKTVLNEVKMMAGNLIDIGIDSKNKLALFCNTSPEWMTMALALLFISSPFVTAYPTLSDDSVAYALNLTEAKAVMVDEKTYPRIVSLLPKLKYIKNIIISSYIEKDIKLDQIEKVNVLKFKDLLKQSLNDISKHAPNDSESLAFIMFTSGSTGIPKGVMISHKNVLSTFDSVSHIKQVLRSSNNDQPHVYASYLPSSHIFEFVFELAMIGLGNTIGYCTPQTLFDTSPMIIEGSSGDLTVLKPTIFITVPLLLERIKKGVLDQLRDKSRLKQLIFECSYKMKMKYRSWGCKTPILDKLVFKVLSNIFGGRMKIAFIGGAYVSRNTEEFANICFGNFKQGYGLTETTDGIVLTSEEYIKTGSCGAPLPNCEIKLAPWPEGNRFPDDKNFPSGEILITGDALCMGYYKNEELTKETFVTDPITGKRWFHSGDIGLILPDKTLRIVDRKKDIIKLLNGEYISLVKIEAIITECNLVEIVCVCPNKTMEFLVALIMPQRLKTKEFLIEKKKCLTGDNVEDFLEDPVICELIGDEIKNKVIKSNFYNNRSREKRNSAKIHRCF